VGQSDPAAPPDAHWLSEEELPPLYTATLAGGRLYVHLDREPPSSIDGNTGESSTIVCLEAKTGHEIWRNDLTGFASEFEETRIDGAPLLHGGRLFALVRRRKPFGFEACFLLRLDPQTGRILHSVHLGEAPTGSYGYRRPTLSHPAANGDRVFVQTNLGTVAAVSASTGHVAWLHRYRSRLTDDAEGSWPARTGRTMRSWQYNPTMLWRDRVVCAPLDTDALLVLDQADGRLIHRIPATHIHTPDYILGIHGRLLYAVGTQVTAWDLEDHKLAWARPLAEGQPLGRGAVTPAGLLIPTTRGLLRYALDGGPAPIHHWPLRSAGNVIALPDQIIVAATDTLFGLVGKEEAFARLARQMDHTPEDPRPALRLAELAFSTGEYDRGLAATHRAVTRAGGFAQLTDTDLRARFFDRLMHFAGVLLEASSGGDPTASKNDDSS